MVSTTDISVAQGQYTWITGDDSINYLSDMSNWMNVSGVPTYQIPLATAQTNQIALINTACQTAITSNGFVSSALGSPYTYPSDLLDQQNMAASVLSSLMPGLPSDWTTPFYCADSNGNWAYRFHTVAQIQQVGTDGKTFILSKLMIAATLSAEIMAATTISAVQSINWT
jgi:hypothetical protein